jgi:hypothetical protein
MSKYSLTHIPDVALARDLVAAAARDRASTAHLLAHVAEFDARKLYRPAAHPSMYSYCVGVLHFSEDAAYKRIQAARAARKFPALFEAVADGRLHLTALVLMAPRLTPENVTGLVAAASHKTKAALELLLAVRFPRQDLPERIQALPPAPPVAQLVPEPVGVTSSAARQPASVEPQGAVSHQLVPEPVAQVLPAKVTPLSPQRFAMQLTIGQGTYDKLRQAQALLGHQILSRDVAQVLDLALDSLIADLQKRKFAATRRPRERQRSSTSARHVPAKVKRAVWKRDRGQCTFSSDSGQRCPERTGLEFDHVDPVARGGQATVEGIRLRCRAHN